MYNIFFLALRRLRVPLITLILIYAVSMFGLVLMPAPPGQPALDFFHAFYFVSYTATTIGFGEIPYTFSPGQRAWVLVCIYLSVIGWTYTLGSLLALFQDRSFLHALRLAKFTLKVRRMPTGFYLILGYGQTGQLLARALDERGERFVVVEQREERVNEVLLAGYHADVPAIAGNAANPELLQLAGILHRNCRGILAVTGDENVNLAAMMASHALRPRLLSIGRARSLHVSRNMSSFGANHVVNMFETVGMEFRMALRSPSHYRLWQTLTQLPGRPIPSLFQPRAGLWLVVGFGRFGHAVYEALVHQGYAVRVIDEESHPDLPIGVQVAGLGVEERDLREAGVREAVGLIACHDHDINNLSAIATAREMNPGLMIVARQNLAQNRSLFTAIHPDLTVVRSQIVARQTLIAMTTPLLTQFLELMQGYSVEWAGKLEEQLLGLCDGEVPERWALELTAQNKGFVHAFLAQPLPPLRLGDLSRHPDRREQALDCLALLYQYQGHDIVLPQASQQLQLGARILFVGSPKARRLMQWALESPELVDYLRTGLTPPRGAVFRWLAARKQAKPG
ncbi:potassium channel family protein [Chitinilyticum piscinae]|uniref:Potassium channel protein n=1 Tax=Chitinilyticum piscinae TaxID=2866724 RepID=A0A8J7FLQ2_9NEIS|nr:NAD-binding protein [Chitinilyticum piscinae]MBE9608626.1 potassium channel protein [Chitinilyticum piscinae]